MLRFGGAVDSDSFGQLKRGSDFFKKKTFLVFITFFIYSSIHLILFSFLLNSSLQHFLYFRSSDTEFSQLLSEDVFIYFSVLKDIFAGYRLTF